MKFYGEASFLGNGQFKVIESNFESNVEPGGAILNAGTMEVQYSKAMSYNINITSTVDG